MFVKKAIKLKLSLVKTKTKKALYLQRFLRKTKSLLKV